MLFLPNSAKSIPDTLLAANAYLLQIEEIKGGRRKGIDWRKIAIDCEPTFAGIRSDYKRRAVLMRLRDAVHARLNVARKNECVIKPQITE